MLAYAAGRPRIGARQSSPNAMLFVICGHIVLIAVVMSAKIALPPRVFDPPTSIISVPLPKEPPPLPMPPPRQPQAMTSTTEKFQPKEVAPARIDQQVSIDVGGASEPASSGGAPVSFPSPSGEPQPVPVTRQAQLLTPPSELKPPYPQSKLLAEEEAALTLRLTIDEQGRVVAVDPVGRADAVFLAAARRHLIAHWRYKPAMKDGRAVPTSIVITLRFELDG